MTMTTDQEKSQKKFVQQQFAPEDFFAVMAMQARYASVIDNDRLEEWPAFFIEKCHYRITTANNHSKGYEASIVFANSRGMLVDRVTALREANIFERQAYRHICGAPVFLSSDNGEIACETSFAVVRIMRDGSSNLFASGRYLDRLVRENNVLKIRERIAICDSSRIDTLLALPL